MKNKIVPVVLLLLLSVLSLKLYAQWSTNPATNNMICNSSGDQAIPKIAVCPNGDSYIGYFSSEAGNYDVRLQRLDYQGYLLWTAPGIMVSNNPQNTWLTDWDMTCDASNHAILVFNDIRNGGNTNIYAYRIATDQSFTWGANGIALSNNTAFNAAPKVAVTAAGNTVVAWMSDNVIVMQKISPAGTLLWGTTGITITGPNRYTWPQLIPVGTDDVILKYYDDSGSTMYPTRLIMAQRYNSSGSAVWASPASVSVAGGISGQTQILPFINDGSDGFYIAWHDDRDNNLRASIFVQHVSSTGTPLLATNGVEVSSASTMNHYYPQLALPPASTDIYVYWNEMNGNQDQWGLYGQKVSSAGTLLWGATGMVFIPVSATDVYPIAARKSSSDMVLFYEEYSGSINSAIKAMRISTTGTFVWTPSPVTMCSVNSQKVHAVVSDFANDQWIASWEDNRSTNPDIYAQNILLSGSLGPGVSTNGTLSGTITLNGGLGNVTQVVVSAGIYSTSPNASGAYSMQVPAGTYTVAASLAGYTPASQPGVVVTTNLTTTVNLTLNALPAGYIDGHVTLVGGSGIVSQAQVSAGSVIVNPDATGHYFMQVTPGTYNVIGSLAAYFPDTVFGVTVANNQTLYNVDLTLNLAPYTGFITGTVTLNGGSGNVTQVIVNAGGFTASPNSSGFYSMEVPAGNYDVSASLPGYLTQIITGVPVSVGQTTANVNFTLVPSANAGTIQGQVTFTGGTANATLATVTAGTYSAHPDINGNYSLDVPQGTYSVTATHPYTNSQTVTNVSVTAGNITTNVNFLLTVERSDMVCMAVDQWGVYLNPAYLVIEGPEGPYTGTITQDSLVFTAVPYGSYSGSCTWFGLQDQSDTVIDAGNHHLVFHYIIDATGEKKRGSSFSVYPNPLTADSYVRFTMEKAGTVSIFLTDATGRTTTLGDHIRLEQGPRKFGLGGLSGSLPAGIFILQLEGEDWAKSCRVVVAR
jgi:hypothetical protein